MKIVISNSSGEPIYLQISEQIKSQILEGKLRAGEALPSMRNLATELRISFMTTKRAYEELEQDGYIESFTGKGSFVKGQNPQMYREEQLRRIETLLEDACGRARKAGVTIEELQEMVGVFYGGGEDE
ncbi:MAG: GntR family transcriptional regulator [Lachnospiraceae bacterium]|nr:GntR family transcriptional regulator [Lachnospiraceae bacterium]